MKFFENITLETLLTNYESFVTLFITLSFGLIGYFIKRRFDLRSRRVEINHSIFQGKRIDAVSLFFFRYSAVKAMWHELPHYAVIRREVSSKQLDEIVQPVLRNFRQSLLELRFYFQPGTYGHFTEIEKGLEEIYDTLGEVRDEYNGEESIVVFGNKLVFTMDRIFKKNDKIMETLCERIRQDFMMSL